jgi:hypothetical protein
MNCLSSENLKEENDARSCLILRSLRTRRTVVSRVSSFRPGRWPRLTWPVIEARMGVFLTLVGEHVSRKPRGESFGVCFLGKARKMKKMILMIDGGCLRVAARKAK